VSGEEQHLKIVALLAGPPGATELWTLHHLAKAGFSLQVVQARFSRKPVAMVEHLRRRISSLGLLGTLSRVLASLLLRHHESKRLQELSLLFDDEHLRRWWTQAKITIEQVPYLNHADTEKILSRLQADFIIRVSGGVLSEKVFSTARVAALNIHHGVASHIRGMCSIQWAIVEGRPEWIGATVHIIDAGIDTGTVLWCGSPQLAPGDTAVDLFFRSHLEAVEALVFSIRKLASGWQPTARNPERKAEYRSSLGILAGLKYLAVGLGKRSRIILGRAVRC
jgi:hypothetical protein